jgi:hypothetical protein
VRLSLLGASANIWRNNNWQSKHKYSEKKCPSTTLSTTNPIRPDLVLNPGRHGGTSATNLLSLLHRQRRHKLNTHNSSEIRTREPSVQGNEGISCLRPSSHCNCNCSIAFIFYSALKSWKSDEIKRGKVIPVTRNGGPYNSETSRLTHFFYTIGSQMAVRLWALCAGYAVPTWRFLVLSSFIG